MKPFFVMPMRKPINIYEVKVLSDEWHNKKKSAPFDTLPLLCRWGMCYNSWLILGIKMIR